jgi:large subunit ribosomal protein L6
MSHIGKKPIKVPEKTKINILKNKIIIHGEFGENSLDISSNLECIFKDNYLYLNRLNNLREIKKLHGLTRSLISNMILGVSYKFFKKLILNGIGYKFFLKENYLILNLGFSHEIKLKIPLNIDIKLLSSIEIIISGIEKNNVTSFASLIRKIRPPEPYKGKGILYENEVIIKKAGKVKKK